jgi:hypothetical protein
MSIEGEHSSDTMRMHQRERNTVGEVDFLVRVLFEEANRPFFVIFGRPENQDAGGIDPSCFLRGKRVTRLSRKLRKDFVENEIAGDEALSGPCQLIPDSDRLRMILVVPEIPADEGSAVDEDQSSLP